MAKTLDARSERSRLALINAGMTMLCENRNTNLSEIAQQAGVGRATLYRQFETKTQLVKAIADTCIKDIDAATEHIDNQAKSYLDALRMMLEAVIPLQQQLGFLMRLDALIDDNDEAEFEAIFKSEQEIMLNLVTQCQEEGSIRKDLSPHWLSATVDGLLYAAWQMVDEHEVDHQKAAAMAFETFCQGVAI